LEQGAKAQHSSAQFNLGQMYRLGEGMKVDIKKAIFWFEQAAKQNNGGAMSQLGTIYVIGDGTKEDPALALKWFKLSAETGNAEGLRNLGVAYYQGKIIEKDLKQAWIYWLLAEDTGDSQAREMIRSTRNELTIKEASEAFQEVLRIKKSKAELLNQCKSLYRNATNSSSISACY
jgi:TPR repeat protein